MKNEKNIRSLKHYLQALDRLHVIIFASYIHRDYFSKQVECEKKRTFQIRLLMKLFHKVRRDLAWNENIILRLEHLYEIIFSLDLLKNRLLDHATFEMCENEFKNISKKISELFSEIIELMSSHPQKNTGLGTGLDNGIQSLELVFQNTLQLIMADPMFFLFFIRDLKSLRDELIKLYDDIYGS